MTQREFNTLEEALEGQKCSWRYLIDKGVQCASSINYCKDCLGYNAQCMYYHPRKQWKFTSTGIYAITPDE